MKVILQKNLYERSFSIFSEAAKNHSIEFLITDVLEEESMLSHHKTGCNSFVIGAEAYSEDFYRSINPGSLVVRYGVGYNAVPIEICRERGIQVAYTPGTLTDSVAEYTFALLLTLCRHTSELDNSMKKKEWLGRSGTELKGKTLAVIGFGQIGQAVARIAKYGFGMRIHAFDKYPSTDKDLADFFSFDYEQVVKEADIISVHLATTPETSGFFNTQRLSVCKQGTLFINTARGELVIEKDLYEALSDKTIGAAAMDVFAKEPYKPTEDVDFRSLPNVVLTPHCGSNTREANDNMAKAVVKNILAYESGSEIVSIPELRNLR